MKKIQFFLLSWMIAQGQAGQPRIMNGSPANVGQFPYQAYISDNFSGACGASIIHKRWLLTAAHCRPYTSRACAVVGTIYKSGLNGTKFNFETFIKHPDYAKKRNKIIHDIALVRLNEDIKFDNNAQPIKLAKDDSKNYTKISATLSGWGVRGPREKSPRILQYTFLNVIGEEKCGVIWNTTMENLICTSGSLFQANRGSACIGDSGGPLVYKNEQIGIVSYGQGRCGIYFPDVYTKVASYIPWIKEQLSLFSDQLP